MAFSDFKALSEVQQKYKIKYTEDSFISNQALSPSDSFLADFEFNKENIDIFVSEASRSEIVISPLLREVYKNHYTEYSFWIQKKIFYDSTLSGTPDYIFSRRSALGKTVLEKPIVIVLKRKRTILNKGGGSALQS